MAQKYTVQEGEHLPMIATKFGFAGINAIWNHPDNADLKQQRKNPNLLAPGDTLSIPDPKQRNESRGTDTKNRFTASVTPLVLRLKLLNLSDKGINRQLTATTAAGAVDANPQSDIYEISITPKDSLVSLKAKESPAWEVDCKVGALDPVTEPSGQQDRLNNLGYFAGFSKTPDADQLQWAVEEFQKDHQASKGLKVTGVCDSATQAALVDLHGV